MLKSNKFKLLQPDSHGFSRHAKNAGHRFKALSSEEVDRGNNSSQPPEILASLSKIERTSHPECECGSFVNHEHRQMKNTLEDLPDCGLRHQEECGKFIGLSLFRGSIGFAWSINRLVTMQDRFVMQNGMRQFVGKTESLGCDRKI